MCQHALAHNPNPEVYELSCDAASNAIFAQCRHASAFSNHDTRISLNLDVCGTDIAILIATFIESLPSCISKYIIS